MWWGVSETFAGATIRIDFSGIVNFTSGTFSGTLSAASGTLGTITSATITGGSITGMTITGGTIRTANSSTRLELSGGANNLTVYTSGIARVVLSGDEVQWNNSSGSGVATISASSGGATLLLYNSDTTNGNILIRVGSSGSLSLGEFTEGSYFSIDGLLGYNKASKSIIPSSDNAITLGTTSPGNLRWADIRSVLINGSDIGFSSGWKIREWPAKKTDIGKPDAWFRENANLGLQILDEEEKLIIVIHKNGNIYCNEVKSLSDLT